MSKTKRAAKKPSPSVPYTRGFRPPNADQRLKALGECLDREFSDGGGFFPPLPKPASIDDWLAQYVETGQTYKQFLNECPWLSSRKIKYCRTTFNSTGTTIAEKYPQGKIYLLPLGKFDHVHHVTPDFDDLSEYAQLFYSLPVFVLPAVELEVDVSKQEAYWVDPLQLKTLTTHPRASRQSQRTSRYKLDARFHVKSGHYQLQVGSLLMKLKQCIPNDALCLMALTMSELYDDHSDLFVAGMAAGNHRVGVFSLYRYNPTLTFSIESWYQIQPLADHKMSFTEQKRVILQRSCKLLVHEIAHLLGVDHCIWYSCCMNGSGHLGEDYQQAMHLCPVDLRKLQKLCGFHVVERYRKMVEFFKKHQLTVELDWTERRIVFLTS